METNNQNNNSGINFTLIIIVALVCLTSLFALFLLKGSSKVTSTGFNVLKSELPLYIDWRETKWRSHTQVAMIWPKPNAKLPVKVTVEIEDSSTGKKYEQVVVIESFHTSKEPLEIGGFLDYHFVPGDRIKLSHRDYLSIESVCSGK